MKENSTPKRKNLAANGTVGIKSRMRQQPDMFHYTCQHSENGTNSVDITVAKDNDERNDAIEDGSVVMVRVKRSLEFGNGTLKLGNFLA